MVESAKAGSSTRVLPDEEKDVLGSDEEGGLDVSEKPGSLKKDGEEEAWSPQAALVARAQTPGSGSGGALALASLAAASRCVSSLLALAFATAALCACAARCAPAHAERTGIRSARLSQQAVGACGRRPLGRVGAGRRGEAP